MTTKIIETSEGWIGFICDGCGKMYPGPDHPTNPADIPHQHPDGGYLCDGCAEKTMVECYECGGTLPLSEAEDMDDSLISRYCHTECPTPREEE